MSETRAATVRQVEEATATGQGRRDLCRHQADEEHRLRSGVLADAGRASFKNSSGVDHAQAAHASGGRRSHRPLDARTREIIAVAVSATNGCRYCVNSHTAALRKLGLSTEALAEVLADRRAVST